MLWLTLFFAVLALLLVGTWFTLAWFSLHPPRAPHFLSPHDFEMPYEDVVFPSRDGTPLSGWWMPHPQPRGIVITCHGYLVNRCEVIGVGAMLYNAGFSILAFDFRAHGKSGGRVCTLGAREQGDIRGALDWLESHAPNLPIIAFGSSMGGATVLLATAHDTRIGAVISDCAFCDARQAGDDWWRAQFGPRLSLLLRPTHLVGAWLTRTSLKTASPERVVSQVAPRPMLVLHAEGDDIVPVRHARRIFAAAQEPKTLHIFPGSGHVQARVDYAAEYYAQVTQFLDHFAPDK